MAKYLTKYENMSAYEADTQKNYPNVSYIAATDEVVWKQKDYRQDYFTIVAIDELTVKNGSSPSYSLNNGDTWAQLGIFGTLTAPASSKIIWKRENSTSAFGTFTITGRFYVEGNVMSLFYGDDFSDKTALPNRNGALSNLFQGNTGLTSAENLVLPSTSLVNRCYHAMFNGCSSLTTAPELPATTLASTCYSYMFAGCTSLTTAPELPATTLGDECYSFMFSGCTGLTTAPVLSATTLGMSCYRDMFNGCTNLNNITCLATDLGIQGTYDWVSGVSATGTFTKAASMSNWPTGNNGIPTGWTVVDAQ